MKFRLIELLQCPCGRGDLMLAQPVIKESPFIGSLSEVRCGQKCALKNCAVSVGRITPLDCAKCYSREIVHGSLRCRCGHLWPIVDGVPRFVPQQLSTDIKKTQSTFSFEWRMFRFGERNWAQDIGFRKDLFLKALDVPPGVLARKLIFDAGCGSGALSIEMAKSFGAEVVALDLAPGVEKAYDHNDSPYVHFVQGSVLEPPLRRQIFDYVYCAGVLVHCPNSREGFKAVVSTLKPGGRCFVWVYHPISRVYYPTDWIKLSTHNWIRKNITSRLPIQLQYLLYLLLMPAFLLKQSLERAAGVKHNKLTWREKMQNMFDSFSPIYQNRHEPQEVLEWYAEKGFSKAEVAYREHEGFGVRGDLAECR